MSTNINEMRYRLLVQQAEDQQLNQLIPKVRKLLDEFFAKEDCGPKWELKSTQLGNLLGVSGETDSVEAVIGFIEYQIGRDKRGKNGAKNWAWNGFGEKMRGELRDLHEIAKGIVGKAIQDSGYSLDAMARSQEIQGVWIDLARLYAGYLRRYFVYIKGD